MVQNILYELFDFNETPNKNMIDFTHNLSFSRINSAVYQPLNLPVSHFTLEVEGTDYHACKYSLNDWVIIGRNAKVTPTKNGQFVTCWQRNALGETEPFSEDTPFDFLTVIVQRKEEIGQFVFSKEELIQQKILTTSQKDGKRGFRVYPPWDIPQSKQAAKTQEWQLRSFYSLNTPHFLGKAHQLFKVKNE